MKFSQLVATSILVAFATPVFGQTVSYAFYDGKTKKTQVIIRRFDGKNFLDSGTPTVAKFTGDVLSGWDWDGKRATYITKLRENKKLHLVVRDFDGTQFAASYKAVVFPTYGVQIRGWSWDGKKTASYVSFKPRSKGTVAKSKSIFQNDTTFSSGSPAATYVNVIEFDGIKFGKKISSTKISQHDLIRSWDWDGTTATYSMVIDGRSRLIRRPFNGTQFGTVELQTDLSTRDVFRAWSVRGPKS